MVVICQHDERSLITFVLSLIGVTAKSILLMETINFLFLEQVVRVGYLVLPEVWA